MLLVCGRMLKFRYDTAWQHAMATGMTLAAWQHYVAGMTLAAWQH